MNRVIRFEDPQDEIVYQTMLSLGLSMLQAVEAVLDREGKI